MSFLIFKKKYFETTLRIACDSNEKKNLKFILAITLRTEDPTALLKKVEGQFDFVYHRFEENLGSSSLTKQWERCVSLVTQEDWVMILGDDDILGKNVVEAFYSNLEEVKSADVIRFSSCKIDEKGNVSSNIFYHPKRESSVEFLFKEKKRSSLSEYAFKRSQIIEIGFKNFPLAWCSDILAVLEFSNFDLVYSINEAIVYVRISALSISGNQDNVRLKNLASEEFSSFIIFKKFHFFNKIERLSIINGYEVAMKRNRKLKIEDKFLLYLNYMLKIVVFFMCSSFLEDLLLVFLKDSSDGEDLVCS